jgi:Ca-activated chloride channel homolog
VNASARATTLVVLLAAGLLAPCFDRPALAQEEDESQIELRADLVVVNIAATGRDGFVTGLTRDDFQVFEDGKPQEIAFFGAEDLPFAAAILLDTSASMEFKLQLARAAAARFLDRTRAKDSVAVFAFSNQVRQVQEFTTGRRDIAEAIWDVSASGTTKLYDCVDRATEALAARPEQRRAILLLSDGGDLGSGISHGEALKRALAAGITFYTIDLAPIGGKQTLKGTQAMAARGALRDLAEKSGGVFFASTGGTDLNDAFARIVEEMSHQYTVGYYPANDRHDGKWRKIGVTTRRPNVSLRTRAGYHAPKG